jgi:hypothetical protein
VFFNLRFPQPHGRHLYAFLPALVVPLAAGLARLGLLRFAVVAHLALSLAAFPSLVSKLRPEGWNDDPRWSATDALRRADPGLVDPDRADLAWLSPEPGSVLPSEEAPVLRWETRDGAAHGPGGSGDVVAYDVILAVDNPLFEHRPWDPDRIVFRTLWAGLDLRGELRLPESFWGAIEPGEMLSVQVLELGSDGLVSARSARADFVKRGP